MIYYIENKNISLRISQALLDEMQRVAIAAFPNETGGMLAGRISACLLYTSDAADEL